MMEPITGWILWRDTPKSPASFRWGTLSSGLSFHEEKTPGAGPWITPGLVDVHAHLGIGETGPAGQEDALRAAKANWDSGVTAIREPGSPTPPVDASPLTVIRAGRHIARPKRYLRGLAIEVENPNDLPKVVAQQTQTSNGWVKLVGDWIDRSNGADSDLDPLWDTHILVDAVAAAHDNGARVAVHAFSRPAIDGLLEARVDTIEHGSGMTFDHAVEAARLGIAVTPTLGQVELFPSFAGDAKKKYPRYAQTMTELYDHRYQWFDDLRSAGVQLLPGTDAGGYQPHGEIQTELQRWVDYGMTETEVVDLATWRARDFLGLPSLHPEGPEEFVIFEERPALTKPLSVVGGADLLRCRRA